MNLLIIFRSLPILFGMAGLILAIFPLSFLPDFFQGELEEARAKCISMTHGLLLLGSLLPCLALLPSWVEENSRELLCAVVSGKTPCFTLILWIFRFYSLIVLLPVVAACLLLQISLLEVLRLLAELMFILGAYYLLLCLLQSALLSAMGIALYVLFSVIECRNTAVQSFCLIRSDLFYHNGFFLQEGIALLPLAVICEIVAFFLEKRKIGINV